MFKLIHIENFLVIIPKDKPRALEDDPSVWSQKHCMGSVHPRREATEHVLINRESMLSISQQLAKYLKDLFWKVSELIDG